MNELPPDIPESEADPLWLVNPGGTRQSYCDPRIFYVVRPFMPAPVIADGMIIFRDGQVHRLTIGERLLVWLRFPNVAGRIERRRRPNLCRAINAGFFTGRLRTRQRPSDYREQTNAR